MMATRVLVIEDNPTNLELVVYLLNHHGYVPLVAMDGEEGLAAVERENPDLIICDIQLPKLSGYEVAENLSKSQKYASIPLIAVTAYSMVGDRDRIMSCGFDGYISKPIDPNSFIKQVESFMKKIQSSKNILSPAEVSQVKKQTTQTRPSFGTILVVDDSPFNRQLFQTLLESKGYEVEITSNIPQALEMLNIKTPRLILSDLHMPAANGIDFLKTVKARRKFKEIPFIIISSSSPNKYEMKECMNLGTVKFIISPIEPHNFLETIKEICELNKKFKKRR